MKCLSVKQPWASLICSGIKDVENRSWIPKNKPDKILIHASQTPLVKQLGRLPWFYDGMIENAIVQGEIPNLDKTPVSAIIGYVEIKEFVKESDSPWMDYESEWKWVLGNAKLFKNPIPYKGKLNLYDVPEIDENNLPETVEIMHMHRNGDVLYFPLSHEMFISDFTEIAHFVFPENFGLFGYEQEGEPLPTSKIVFIDQFTGEQKERIVKSCGFYKLNYDDGDKEEIMFTDQFGEEWNLLEIIYTF